MAGVLVCHGQEYREGEALGAVWDLVFGSKEAREDRPFIWQGIGILLLCCFFLIRSLHSIVMHCFPSQHVGVYPSCANIQPGPKWRIE